MAGAEPTAPRNYDELCERLREKLPQLAAGRRRIAQLILTDPEGTAFRSIAETARLAEVHESSLVRFATSVGLSGYPALVELCRAQLAEQAQLVRRFEQARQHGDSTDLLAETVECDQRNLARTFGRLAEQDWERVVGLLADAPNVHVIGLRKCHSVAYLLSYLLRLVRPKVYQLGTQRAALVDELRDLAEGDVLVAASIHRYTADTVRVLAHAQRRGLHTVALTDSAASPLSSHAEVTLRVETAGTGILRSLTAFTALVQALANAVAVRAGARSRDNLRTDEALLDEFGVYTDE
ncbi:RpiR family transcriptional regulator [Tamaricihabitans halophyticus]|uniref:RpiR family transcriptional regulator n=1 Tax=Tamaricihabitans halophyticus TaxID=1262583 RepID=A0A4R2R579_9PSEU|nr:MurR/RpiR family transcriptional regulator [Tamaricihabitans halophyticus]TCP57187.1 RpiR family transcriptional regulator [Tamaricihabitans halophyticus]